MNIKLSEEHISVKEAAREFARTICKPGVIQRDTTMQYPYDEVKQMAELGFMGMMVDPNFGGSGLDTISYVLAMEEISKVDNSCSVIMSVNNSLVCWGIEHYGTEEQKGKYLPLLCSGNGLVRFVFLNPKREVMQLINVPRQQIWGIIFVKWDKKLDYQRKYLEIAYCYRANRTWERYCRY